MADNDKPAPTVWEVRFDALRNVLRTMVPPEPNAQPPIGVEKAFADQGPKIEPPLPRRTTLENLAKCLRAFAESQFYFFYRGLNTKDETRPYNLEPSPEFWRRYAVTTILNQVQHDIEAIQRITYQRADPNLQSKLAETDKLAMQALTPAVGKFIGEGEFSGLLKNLTVVTYFQKFSAIVHVPYAPVALIGIPATSLAVPQDYLAIPHEAGHYVYRHGRLPESCNRGNLIARKREHIEDALRRCVREALRRIKLSNALYDKNGTFRWLEEMFADIYGCLVAGPVIALDFQDLQLQKRRDQFLTLDDDHPTPLFRPLIYIKVLAASENPAWQKMANLLYWTWETNNNVVQGRTEFKTKWDIDVNDLISPGTSLSSNHPVDIVIQLILDLLDGIKGNWSGDWSQGKLNQLLSSSDALTDAEQASLYSASTGYLQELKADPPPELELAKNVDVAATYSYTDAEGQTVEIPFTKLWVQWIKSENFFADDRGPNQLPPIKDKREIQHGRPDTPAGRANAWIPILKARGWAVDGPNGQWKG
jgi:hypothetical protein